MNRRLALTLALLAVAGIAAASAITVTQRQDIVNIFAERYTLRDQFVVLDSTLLPVSVAAGAVGSQAAPTELAGALPAARTALVRDHWAYAVTVRENAPGAVAGGTYEVRLLVDGAPAGTLYVTQSAPDDTLVEGVRASFDIGTILSTDSLYHVEVKPFVPTGPTVAVLVRSNPNGNLTWLGAGDVVNPTIPLAVGTTLQLTALNADAGFHDIGIRTSSNTLVDPPGWSADIGADEQATIAWVPSAAGTYHYICKYHASMRGTIAVSA